MNTSQLSATLRSLGVPTDAYSIGADRDEAYCLTYEYEGWLVYYSERAYRNRRRAFTDEAQACEDLLGRLLRDGVVRSRTKGGGR